MLCMGGFLADAPYREGAWQTGQLHVTCSTCIAALCPSGICNMVCNPWCHHRCSLFLLSFTPRSASLAGCGAMPALRRSSSGCARTTSGCWAPRLSLHMGMHYAPKLSACMVSVPSNSLNAFNICSTHITCTIVLPQRVLLFYLTTTIRCLSVSGLS